MNASQAVGTQFAREIGALASMCALPVREQDVELTLSVANDAKAEATLCYRLNAGPAQLQKAAPILKGMRRTYPAEYDGKPITVNCVLAGGIHDGALLDWKGAAVECLG